MIFICFILGISLVASNGMWIAARSDWIQNFNNLEGQVESSNKALELERAPKVPTPICLCEHGVNYHQNGKCHGSVDMKVRGLRTRYEHAYVSKCSCKVYTGPEPLPEYYHPLELT